MNLSIEGIKLINEKLYNSSFYENGDKIEDIFMKFITCQLSEDIQSLNTKHKQVLIEIDMIECDKSINRTALEDCFVRYRNYENELSTLRKYIPEIENWSKHKVDISKEFREYGFNNLCKLRVF